MNDPTINLYEGDCLPAMKKMTDNQYDLAIVDPPYGLEWEGTGFIKKNIQERNLENIKEWEQKMPKQDYFNELLRVSRNQIIWGGNYFGDYLGKCKAPIIWDKKTGTNTFADGEYAWTSFKTGTLRIFRHQWCGAFKDSERKINATHPTQKPVALYKWLLKNYAKEGYKIVDTHGGSMSIAIACWDYGFDLDLYEIDKDYFEDGKKRFETHKKELKPFFRENEVPNNYPKQNKFF